MAKIFEFPIYWICESNKVKYGFYAKTALEAATNFMCRVLLENDSFLANEYITCTNNISNTKEFVNAQQAYDLMPDNNGDNEPKNSA